MSLQTSPLKMDMRPQVILNGLPIFPSLSLPRYLSSPHTSLRTVISTSSPNLSSVSHLQNPLPTDTSKSLKLKNVALTSHQNCINGLPCSPSRENGKGWVLPVPSSFTQQFPEQSVLVGSRHASNERKSDKLLCILCLSGRQTNSMYIDTMYVMLLNEAEAKRGSR